MVMRERRGVALVIVLWILVLLGLAASELIARARTESDMVTTLKSRAIAQYAAESGILTTVTSLEAKLAKAPGPIELAARTRHLDTLGRSGDLAGSSGQFATTVLDLNARLDLVHADSGTLRALFAEFVSAGRAAAIVGALRRDPVTRFSELARVPEVGDTLALTVAPYVTVGSDGVVNVNSAPVPVLAALPGISPEKARALAARRDGGGGGGFSSVDDFRPTPGSQDVVPVEGTLLAITPTHVMVVSRGWLRGSPLTHEIQATYLVFGGKLTLRSWEERDR
jgi:hypothetical protein